MRTRCRNPGCRGGFTMIEMTVVLVIFVLLAGGIYTVVNSAIGASAVLSEENVRVQRLDAFISLLRRTFHNLPATTQITGGVRSDGGRPIAEIVLRDAPGVFAWGHGGPAAGTVLLSAVPRLGGGSQFSLLTLPGNLGEQELRDAVRNGQWLRLLPDLREAPISAKPVLRTFCASSRTIWSSAFTVFVIGRCFEVTATTVELTTGSFSRISTISASCL